MNTFTQNPTQNNASMMQANTGVNADASVDIKPTPLTNSLGVKEELEKLGEKLGEFRAYDSQLPIAEIAGTRIVKCLYQINPKTKTKAQENAYVRLPTKHLTEEHICARVVELSPYILGWLQEQEDKEIKDLHKKGGLQVYTEYLSLDKIIEVLEAASESSRLNKEKIETWFTDKLEAELAELFGAKMGLNESSSEHEVNKLVLVLAAYKAKFAQLASPKSYLKEEDCLAMIKVIQSVDEARDSILGIRFVSKLGEMNKKVDDLLLAL